METMFDKARRIMSYYWRSRIWWHMPLTSKALSNCSKGGMDALEIIRSREYLLNPQHYSEGE